MARDVKEVQEKDELMNEVLLQILDLEKERGELISLIEEFLWEQWEEMTDIELGISIWFITFFLLSFH